MRIGIDCRIYGGVGGSLGRSVEGLIQWLAKIKSDDEYILFFNEPQFSSFEIPDTRFQKISVNAPIFSVAEQTSFLLALYSAKLDQMHFMGYHAPLLYLRPSIVTIYDLLPLFYPNKHMSGSFRRQMYRTLLHSVTRRAKKIIAPSRHVARDLSEMVNVPEEKIEVITPATDLEHFKKSVSVEEQRKYLLQQGIQNPYLLFVGSITEHKNLVRFVQAYATCGENITDIDLVIVGKEDASYHELRHVMIELGLQKRLHIMGSVEDDRLPMLYQGAIVTFSPSLYEGFSLSVRESLASGVPMLSANVPGLREATGEDGALFFRPLSVESMQKAIEQIVSDQLLRESLVVRWKALMSAIDIRSAVEKIQQIYHAV